MLEKIKKRIVVHIMKPRKELSTLKIMFLVLIGYILGDLTKNGF